MRKLLLGIFVCLVGIFLFTPPDSFAACTPSTTKNGKCDDAKCVIIRTHNSARCVEATPTPGGPTLTPTPITGCNPPGFTSDQKARNDPSCVITGVMGRNATCAKPTPTPNGSPTPGCNPPGLDANGKCQDPKCTKVGGGGHTFICKLQPTPAAVTPASSCTTWDCNGTSCYAIGGLSYCNISSKKGQPLQCKCTTPPSPQPPPCNLNVAGLCMQLDTSLGIAIPTTPVGVAKILYGIVLSLSGGIALILIIFSGYNIMTSQGDPEKIQAAKDVITSTIIGLVFMIFSLVVLQIIGVDILRIPGLKP